MTLQKGFTDELKATGAVAPLGIAADELLDSQMTKAGQFADTPIRLYAAFPTPDSKLYFRASKVQQGDGSSRTIPAIDDQLIDSLDGSVDMQADPPTVAGVTLLRDGAAFTMPTAASGDFVRLAFSRRADGSFDSKASAALGSLVAIQAVDPATLWGAMEGLPNGYIDLECTSSSPIKFKTAGSGGLVIENGVSGSSRIFNVGAGGGAGGGADRTYKITSFSATGATLKGGYAAIDDSRVLASGLAGTTSTTVGVDQTVNLDNVLAASGLVFASNTLYTLAIDLTTLAAPFDLTDNGRRVLRWGEANLKLLTAHPEAIDPRRYIWLDQIRTGAGADWAGSTAIVKPGRVHDSLTSFFPYAERYEPPTTTINTESALHTLNHGLTGEPQVVLLYYWNGTTKIGLNNEQYLLDKTASQLKISSSGLTFGGGQYLEVKAFYIPTIQNVASTSRTFRSVWYQDTATTTVAHGLTDMEDIAGYEVQEWDVVAGKRRIIDRSALVVNFDGTNFFLDWSSLTPTANLQYRIVAGGSPLPWTIPLGFDSITNRAGTGAPNFPFGATGISATITDLTIASVTDPNVTINGGYQRLADGREIATYDGGGAAAADFGTNADLTTNLNTLGGFGSPAANEEYYLYVNLDSLGASITQTDTGRVVYAVTAANLALLTQAPELVNRAKYAFIGSIKTVATSWVGALFASGATKSHENGPLAVNPIVYRLPKQTVGAVGSAGQVVAGHILSAKTFPSISAALVSWFNLANASGADGSGNARNLTPVGSPVGATGILGGALTATAFDGVNDVFNAGNVAHFNPGNGKSFAFGGWVKPNSWTTLQSVAGNFNGGADRGFFIEINSTNLAFVGTNTAGTEDYRLNIANPFTGTSWQHLLWVFDHASQLLKAYINGLFVGSMTAANMRSLTTNDFRIGNLTVGGSIFTGAMEEFFFYNSGVSALGLTDEDIRRVYAYRRDHFTKMNAQAQEWLASIFTTAATQDDQSWIVDKNDVDSVFWDFSGLASSNQVEVVLRDLGLNPAVIPAVPPFDQTYTVNPSFPLAHNQLGEVPEVLAMQEVSAGVWEPVSLTGHVNADVTNLTGTLAAFFSGGALSVRLIARAPRVASASAPTATGARYGLVKTFVPSLPDSVLAISGNTAITDTDGIEWVFVTTGAGTVITTLPSAVNNKGRFIGMKKVDAAVGTARFSGSSIDGQATADVTTQYAFLGVKSDGTVWHIVT